MFYHYHKAYLWDHKYCAHRTRRKLDQYYYKCVTNFLVIKINAILL